MSRAAAVARRATVLLAESAAYPSGNISPSVYETGRVAALSPWVAGQDGRLRFLLTTQGPDGVWGEFDAYTLIPTLSAVEALLTCLRRHDVTEQMRGRLVEAAHHGLQALFKLLDPACDVAIADTIAAELIIPALLHDIHEHLDRLAREPLTGLHGWTNVRFDMPTFADPGLLRHIRTTIAPLPAKLCHTLEIAGTKARGSDAVQPVNGNIGCSPAATAAWLGDIAPAHTRNPSVIYLNDLAARYGGPVPGVSPISTFEYAWSVNALLSAGVEVDVPTGVTASLQASLTEEGAAVAPGLLCDADSTAVVLSSLAQLGVSPRLDYLYAFDRGSHFVCWEGERNPSVSANAHVLETLADHETRYPERKSPNQNAVTRISEWLQAHQHEDGYWLDKWHASPYYATHCCVRALSRSGAALTLDRARHWVLATQRPDGAWGNWCGTREETAYAIQILLGDGRAPSRQALAAAARGRAFLRASEGSGDPPLWHDKDLYAPINVIQAEVLAASHLADICLSTADFHDS
jgi:hypothetical protein